MNKSSFRKKIIRILPESLINKIAAGEVVERPSSVVKELLENSIDAGANEIQVKVKNGGKDLISIRDNGIGMNETNAKLSFERHATSKIEKEEDLFNIMSLGFRGEALAAISSVSYFELLTCDNQNQSGTRVFIKGGEIEQVGKIGFPKGTKITVEKLFYNTPARRKFLKTTATEFHHIQQHIIQKSLSHPNIHFRLTHNKQVLLNLSVGKELEVRIEQLFGEEFKEKLMPVKHEETYIKFDGFISFPSKLRTSRRWQYIFVNGRNVKSLPINHGIYEGYGTFLGKNQHPAFFINIIIDPSEIDVNVHPAKTEIRFRNSHLIHTILVDQFSRFLKDAASRRFFGKSHLHNEISSFEISGQMELPIKNTLNLKKFDIDKRFSKKGKNRIDNFNLNDTESKNLTNKQKNIYISNNGPNSGIVQISKKNENFDQRKKLSIFDNSGESNLRDEIKNFYHLSPYPNRPKNIRYLFQYLESYIFAQNIEGLICFDQNLFLEYLIFKLYKLALQKKNVVSSTIKKPILIEFSEKESEILIKYLEDFLVGGFSVSHFGKNSFSVYSNPEILFEDKVEGVIREIINRIFNSNNGKTEVQIFKVISYVVATHGKLISAKELNKNEIEFLLAKWEELGSPSNSINNQPMFFKMSIEELKRKFN